MPAYCMFTPDGVLESVVNARSNMTAREYWGVHVPDGCTVGIFESQEMLPASKLQMCCHAARIANGKLRIDSLEELQAKYRRWALINAEQAVIQLCQQVLILTEAARVLGEHSTPSLLQSIAASIERRDAAVALIAGRDQTQPPINPNLARIAGQEFQVVLEEAC